MEYKLKIGPDELPATVVDQTETTLTVEVEATPHKVRYERINDHLIHLEINAGDTVRQIKAYIAGDSDEKTIIINGRAWQVRDLDAQTTAVRKGKGSNIPDQVTPPMPAVVVKVSVAVGDLVKKGQEVVVVSAMKMESTLRAPFDGRVTGVNAAVNDKVAPGQVLVDIEKADETEGDDHE